MAIKARFWVTEFNEKVIGQNNTIAQVVMKPVTRETDDNIQWSQYSPSGEFNIMVTQKEGGAFEAFKAALGKDVAITIDVIEPEPAAATE